MNNPDQDTLVRAIEDARRILGEYKSSLATIMTSPGNRSFISRLNWRRSSVDVERDAKLTVERLLAVLDRNDVVHALDRINRRRAIRLVE
jgi:hypothetical protein